MELRQLLWALFGRKWEILIVACLVIVPVAIWTLLAERLYRSTAMVQIDPEPVQVLPYREVDLPSISPNYEMFMRSQEQILRGPTLVSRIAERMRSGPDAAMLAPEIPKLWERFSIQRLQETQIFALSYVAPSPQVAAKVANTFAEEYIKLHFESRQETRERARDLLRRELENLEQRTQVSEKEMVAYAQKHGIATNSPDGGLIPQKLTILGQQLAAAESAAFAAQSRRDSLERASVSEFPEGLTTPAIAALTGNLLQLEHDLTVLRASFGENWPAVVQKRGEIALVRGQLESEKAAALGRAREQATLDYRTAENNRRMVASSLAEQERLAHQLESATIQYNILRRDVETSQTMYEALLQRLNQTSVTTGMELGGIRVVEKALPSGVVDSPKVVWNLLLASVLGVAIGICFAFARHYWNTSVSTVEEVEHLTVLPVLGTLPLVRSSGSSLGLLSRRRKKLAGRSDGAASRSHAKPLSLSAPAAQAAGGVSPSPLALRSLAVESVRNVCASILLSQSGRPPRVLMVTSAIPSEGKTTLVAALGRAFADFGNKTLLVECDLRRPEFGARFGIGSEGGLSLFLSGHVSPAPTIHATSIRNLFVVGAGPVAPNPAALLGSERMASFIRQMLSTYQFVILDTPPALTMADARVLARMVEGVILVVRAGHVPRTVVRRVCSLLEQTGVSVLGAVLNGVDSEAPYYKYYRKYYAS